MATKVIHYSYVELIGRIWMPSSICAYKYDLGEYDVGNLQTLDREGVESWLLVHAGDFQHILDFHANIWNHFDKCDVEIAWDSPESEYTFNDLMYPSDEDA